MIIKEILKGKTLARILMNEAILIYTQKSPLAGQIIDFGSKSSNMSYNRFIKKTTDCIITYTDLNPQSEDVQKINLEEKFKIQDDAYDAIMCLNTLEHIYNFKNVIEESARIVKKGGVFIGTTPFLVGYHPDPNDYFRYTIDAIERIFEESGFEKIEIKPLGFGPISTGLYNVVMLMPKPLRVLCMLKNILLDKLLIFFTQYRHGAKKYPLGYFFVFRKK